MLLFPVPYQLYSRQHRGIQHTGHRPNDPAVSGLAVAFGAKGIDHKNCRRHQPVDHAHRPGNVLLGFLPAGIVALLQQLLHRTVNGPAVHKEVHTDPHYRQQQAYCHRHKKAILSHRHDSEQRHKRKNTQHRTDGVHAVIGRLKSPLPFLYHAGHTVFRLKRLLLQKLIFLRLVPTAQEQRHRNGQKNAARSAQMDGEGLGGQAELGRAGEGNAGVQIDYAGGKHDQRRHRADDNGVHKDLEDAPHALNDGLLDIGGRVDHNRGTKTGFIGEYAALKAPGDCLHDHIAAHAAGRCLDGECAAEDGGKSGQDLLIVHADDDERTDDIENRHEGHDALVGLRNALNAPQDHQRRDDEQQNDWLLATSEGFYSLKSFQSTPVKISRTPPVSVMGINVLKQDKQGNWLTGSFSGMYVWNRHLGNITDFFTGKTAPETAGPPFGNHAITGYSSDFDGKLCIAEYEKGSGFASMPANMETLPMSLWNFAQEIHTGRIYTVLGKGTLVFIFFAGLGVLWSLITGYIIRRRKS